MRRRRWLDLLTAAAIVGCLCGIALLMGEKRFAGNAVAVDGDSLVMEGRRIRLRGLDAPELSQTCQRGAQVYRCGIEARSAIRALIAGETVTCAIRGRDRFFRDLASCDVRGQDIGANLVKRGLAVSFGDYEDEEREARDARRGIWAGTFETPQAWRRQHETERRP